MGKYKLLVLRTEACNEDGQHEYDAAAGKAVLESNFVHVGADDEDGHEEKEEDSQGADLSDCRGGMGVKENAFVVCLEDTV